MSEAALRRGLDRLAGTTRREPEPVNVMDHIGSMTALIVGGGQKEDCPYVTDAESSELWDRLAAEVAEIKARGQMVQIISDL